MPTEMIEITDRCDCGRLADRPVKVATMPGRSDARVVVIPVCQHCYVRDDWAELDLALPAVRAKLMQPQNSFGAQLRQYRERATLSMGTLARNAGVHVSLLGRLEDAPFGWTDCPLAGAAPHQPARDVVIRIGIALWLTPPQVDELLMLAGYAPLQTRQVRREGHERAHTEDHAPKAHLPTGATQPKRHLTQRGNPPVSVQRGI